MEGKIEKQRCKKKIWSDWHGYQCSRNEWKDGYCKQHHPETKKLRDEESAKKYKEKWEKSPSALLKKALDRIKELENEIEKLRGK